MADRNGKTTRKQSHTPDGALQWTGIDNRKKILDQWCFELFKRASRFDLKLAWAITIHSSQGMTIDALEVDLGRDIFTCGQAYTGLSRARNSASVRVVSVMAKSFTTNSKVLNFFQDNCI